MTKSSQPFIAGQKFGIPIRVGNKTVGYVLKGTFFKFVQRTKHLYQKIPSWCFNKETLAAAAEFHATQVVVVDKETGVQYRTDLATINSKGWGVPDYGHGAQWGLALRHWETFDPGDCAVQPDAPAFHEPSQADLF